MSFATISFSDSTGTYANEDGMATIPENCKEILISCIGYEKTVITVASLKRDVLNTVNISSLVYTLDPILIEAKKTKSLSVGFCDYKPIWDHAWKDGVVWAQFISNDFSKPCYIRKIKIETARHLESAGEGYLKVHVFSVDPKTYLPSEELLKKEIVVKSDTVKTQLLINIANQNILLSTSGLFIGFEWLGCFNSSKCKVTHPYIKCTNKYKTTVAYRKGCFGQNEWNIIGSAPVECDVFPCPFNFCVGFEIMPN